MMKTPPNPHKKEQKKELKAFLYALRCQVIS